MLGQLRWNRCLTAIKRGIHSSNEFCMKDFKKIQKFLGDFDRHTNLGPKNINNQLLADSIRVDHFSDFVQFIGDFWYKKLISNEELKILFAELKKKRGGLVNVGDLDNLLHLAKIKYLSIDNEIVNKIVDAFINFSEQVNFKLVCNLAEVFVSRKIQVNSHEFWRTFENLVVKYQLSYTITNFCTILRFTNVQVLKIPNDLHTKLEPRICQLVKTSKPDYISSIMQMYCGAPLTHHFTSLASAIFERIKESPSDFFKTSNMNYSTTIHYFGKFKYYNEIGYIAESMIPIITPEMRKSPLTLGHYFQGILRKPGTDAYKNYIISQILDMSDELDYLRKQKIILAMVKNENELFWNNVKKLGVFWKPSDFVFIKKEFEILEKYGLIKE